MCKPLHAGTASEHGLRAARLAAKGFTARGDSLECDQGFASSQSDHLEIDAALAEPPQGWHLRNNLFKHHAACYLTHAPIECAQGDPAEEQLPARAGEEDHCSGSMSGADKVCNIPHPTSGLEAKFSLRQTVAMALTGVDTANVDSYNAAITQDPRMKALRDKMEIEFKPSWAQVAGRDGDPARRRHDARSHARIRAFPGPMSPSSAARSRPSSTAWSRRCWAPPARERLHDAIERIDTLADVGELARASTK